MPIARLIFIKVDPDDADAAVRLWKDDCAPLMISSPGCLSEELLRSTDHPGEMISYSEWNSQEDIERYRESDALAQIKEHTRPLVGESPSVKLYELVG